MTDNLDIKTRIRWIIPRSVAITVTFWSCAADNFMESGSELLGLADITETLSSDIVPADADDGAAGLLDDALMDSARWRDVGDTTTSRPGRDTTAGPGDVWDPQDVGVDSATVQPSDSGNRQDAIVDTQGVGDTTMDVIGGKDCDEECTEPMPWCTDSETVGVCGTTLDGCTRLFKWSCPATQVCVDGTCQCSGIDGPVCHNWDTLAGSMECGAPNPKVVVDSCQGQGCWKDACVSAPEGEYVNILPTGTRLNDVWVGPEGFLAVGNDASVVHEVGEQILGRVLSTGSTDPIEGVYGLPSGVTFAIASRALWRHDDSGWSVVSKPTPPKWVNDSIQLISSSQLAVWAASENAVYHGGKAGTFYRFDGSASVPIPHPHEGNKDVWIRGIWGSAPEDVFIVGTPGVALHYDGKTLKPIPELDTSVGGVGGLEAIDGNGPDDVYALRDDAIWRLNGGIWAPMDPPPPLTAGTTDLAVTISGNIYLTGGTRYHWFDGAAWHTVEHGIENGYLYGVDAYGERVVFTGFGGLLLEVDGNSFALLTSPAISAFPGENLTDVWGTPDGTVFATGSFGRVYRRIGSNPTEMWDLTEWVPSDSPSPLYGFMSSGEPHTVARVWASSADNAYIGSLGIVARFDGNSWQKQNIPGLTAATIITTIAGTGPDNVYVGGYAVGVSGMFAHWDGSFWAKVPMDGVPDPAVGAIWAGTDGSLFAIIGGWLYSLQEGGFVKVKTGWGGSGMGMQLCASHVVRLPSGSIVVGHGGVSCPTESDHIFASTQTGVWHRLSYVFPSSNGLFHAASTPNGNFVLVNMFQGSLLLDTQALTAFSLLYPTTYELPTWARDMVLRPVFDYAAQAHAVWISDGGDAYFAGTSGNVIRAPLDE